MVLHLNDPQTRLLRLRSQRLFRQSFDAEATPAEVVKAVCGIQAQEVPAANLAVGVRSRGLTVAGVEEARLREHSIIRTWGVRDTLHFIAAEDLGWLIPLLGPVFIAASRRRYAELGLDENTLSLGTRLLREALASRGPLTREEIVQQLSAQGLKLEGQARPYLINRGALEGFLCLGPDRGREPTYVLVEDWIKPGRALPREAALAELARRYLSAYAPAGPEDLAAWSGLKLSEARAAWSLIAGELEPVEIGGGPAWMLTAQVKQVDELRAHPPLVRLLPRFDTSLLGYASRGLVVAPEHEKRINRGGGLINPVLLVDGRAVGTWKASPRRDHLEIVVDPFEALAGEVIPGLESEVTALASFLGIPARFCLASSP